MLGQAISDAVSLLNPSLVVIGGQLAHADEPLLAGIREAVYRRSLPLATRDLQITTSKLDERAGVTGLALMLGEHIFSPRRVDSTLGEDNANGLREKTLQERAESPGKESANEKDKEEKPTYLRNR